MTKIGDGGPAFPIEARPDQRGGTYYSNGMTLRDAFAIAALQGDMAAQGPELGNWMASSFTVLADRCYEIADAMLAARAK